MGGVFNNAGTLYTIDNLPYAVDGFYPLLLYINGSLDTVDPNVTIGYTNTVNSQVTFLAGAAIKFNTGLYLDVFGSLDLQSTPSSPVVFTSFKDDSIGGDTNHDGGATWPAKGDWTAVYLESSLTRFKNAVVKYADEGLHIYFYGAQNENINPEVVSTTLVSNNTGLTLWAAGAGDILSEIHHNLFTDNTTDILGHANVTGNGPLSTGRLMAYIHDNDLLGPTDYGVNNLSTNWTITATNNYWNDPSGPAHSTNPGGQGTTVSDRVLFNPWRGSPVYTGVTYSVLGRVVNDDPHNPIGISGVIMHLSNGLTTTTNFNGYFGFNNLQPGNYAVLPVLSGYVFGPSSFVANVPPDANGLVFVGSLTTQPTYSIFGHVRDSNGWPVDKVILSLSPSGSTLTDSSGQYSFAGLLSGTYTITPHYLGYDFTPSSQVVTLPPDAQNKDFTLNGEIGIPFKIYLPLIRR